MELRSVSPTVNRAARRADCIPMPSVPRDPGGEAPPRTNSGFRRRFNLASYGAGAGILVMGCCLAALVLGGVQKAPCSTGLVHQSCYSDITRLWTLRDLGSHAVPYIHGGVVAGPQGAQFTGHELEYPVLTGLFIWATSLAAHSAPGFLVASILALAPFALCTAWMLYRLVGRRAILFAAAPTLVWYAFLNWDLPAVAVTVAAVYAWRKDRMWLAGALLGVGACLKLWPALLLAPLACDLLSRRRRHDLLGAISSAAAVAAALNLPFMIANFGGWLAPFRFQAMRPPDASANSLWTFAVPSGTAVGSIDRYVYATYLCVFAAILFTAWSRSRQGTSYPFVQTSAALVMVFVALGKVHSPQYALWVLALLVLVRVRFVWWLAFVATDAWLFAQWTVLAYHPALQRSAIGLSDLVLVALVVVSLACEPAFGVSRLPHLGPAALGRRASASLSRRLPCPPSGAPALDRNRAAT